MANASRELRGFVRFLLILLFAFPSFGAVRVLFVGNSLTYTNDLPARVEKLAKAEGVDLFVRTQALPDYSLEDHLRNRRSLMALRETWDFVVIQQGPSAAPESRELLLRDVARIRKGVRDAKIVVFMVWPSLGRLGDFDRVEESYELAANAIGGILAPAGRVWRASGKLGAMYAADGLHPSELGSQTAAEVIYRAIVPATAP
jgi:hypothetical protein